MGEKLNSIVRARLEKAIKESLDPEMDEFTCREWMCVLPDAKRFVNNKIKICQRRIRQIELDLEIVEGTIAEDVRKHQGGSISERKAIIDTRFKLDPRYKSMYEEMYKYQELMDGYYADLDNLTEKSFAVRKMADFEKVHYMYDEE